MKKPILIFLSVCLSILLISLSSCYIDEGTIKGLIDDFPEYLDNLTLGDYTINIAEDESDYAKIYNAYHKAHVNYFKPLVTELQLLNNLKYSFADTVHKLGETLIEPSVMFFGANASETVDYHFNIKGYENRSFSVNENTAVFIGTHNKSEYRHELTYNTDGSFVYIVYKDSIVNECLSATLLNNQLLRAYYNKDLGYVYEIESDSSGDVKIGWSATDAVNDHYLTPGNIALIDSFASSSHTNYIMYEDGVLSGEIND